jgi:lipid-binding SYLF domain-containing protein
MSIRHKNTVATTRMFTGLSMLGLLAGLIAVGGCSTAPKSESGREDLHANVQTTLRTMKDQDPSLDNFLKNAHAYALFPTVGKGGLIAGGAYGRGEVYRGEEMIGFADLSQATIGAQAGGQEFAELIVFESAAALERFKSNKLKFAANASAVALKSGTAASARYDDGVAVFIRPTGGLMVEAAVGGQSFSYRPRE